jgi:hypothetical protein
MSLFAKAFRPLQTLLPGLQSRPRRSPSAGAVPRNRFRPGVEPLESRAMLSAGPTALFHPPTADARVVREQTVSVPLTALDGTYQVFVFGIPGGFPGFQVQVNNGQIIAPPAFGNVPVIQVGRVSITGQSQQRQSVAVSVSGRFTVFLPNGPTARGSYKGHGTLFLQTNVVSGHGTWNATVAGRRFSGAWRAERI